MSVTIRIADLVAKEIAGTSVLSRREREELEEMFRRLALDSRALDNITNVQGDVIIDGGTVIAEWLDRIILYRASGGGVEFFPRSDPGMAEALAAAKGGDDIIVPPITLLNNYIIPANITVSCQGTIATIFKGRITLNNGSFLRNASVTPTLNSALATAGITGPGSGKAYLNTVSVTMTNNGTGNAYGLQMGAGNVDVRESYFSGQATGGGSGYGVLGSTGVCNLSEGTTCAGSTAKMSGANIFDFSFDTEIHLNDSAGAFKQLFPFTSAGLDAALTAATSGDIIKLPSGTLGGNHTIGSGVEVTGQGENTVLSGTITNNGILANCHISGTLTNNGTLRWVSDTTSYAARRSTQTQIERTSQIGSDQSGVMVMGNLGASPSAFSTLLNLFGTSAGNKIRLSYSDNGKVTAFLESTTDVASGGGDKGYLSLQVRNDSLTMIEAIRILSSGNVGVGTASPGEVMHVDGNIKSEGYYDAPEIATPANPAADRSRLYPKDSSGITKWFYLRSNGTEVELSGITNIQKEFIITGSLTVSSYPIRIYNQYGQTLTISEVFLSVGTAPVGAAIIVDVNKGGTTIFTTQSNRPQIAAGANTGNSTTIEVPSWADGEYLTVDIDQVGSTTPGSDLTVHIIARI